MTYALVRNGVIEQVGGLPRLWNDGTRDYDFRNLPGSLPAGVTLASLGWLDVVEVARPADTATTTTDRSVALVAGKPTEVWTSRPWTAEELTARTAQANQTTVEDDLRAALTTLATLIGATTDPAGTGTLRAIKNQTKATINADPSASIKALADALITVARNQRKDIRVAIRDYSATD